VLSTLYFHSSIIVSGILGECVKCSSGGDIVFLNCATPAHSPMVRGRATQYIHIYLSIVYYIPARSWNTGLAETKIKCSCYKILVGCSRAGGGQPNMLPGIPEYGDNKPLPGTAQFTGYLVRIIHSHGWNNQSRILFSQSWRLYYEKQSTVKTMWSVMCDAQWYYEARNQAQNS